MTETIVTPTIPLTNFTNFNLHSALQETLIKNGFETPTLVQQRAIPAILTRKDFLVSSKTGSGKTLAFLLPTLHHLLINPNYYAGVRALVLVPTRELAAQVLESIKTYGAHLPLIAEMIVGGASINMQIRQLRHGCDIIVATTGRLCDHMNERNINLSSVEMLVLDEADRMLDMGFLPDIRRVIGNLPKQRQNLLFSATYSAPIKALANQILQNPILVEANSSE